MSDISNALRLAEINEVEFIDTHVHFKGRFLRPKGGYVITERDRKNTKYCLDKYRAQNKENEYDTRTTKADS